MRLLLDTHTFMWWDSDADQLSERARYLCESAANLLVVSVVSVWEMQIKHKAGKLPLPVSLEEIIRRQQLLNQVEILPVTLSHVFAQGDLPLHHRDPFDRLLIAQARAEGMCIVSADAVMRNYPVVIEW